jgi:TorA maturation chaperone TorD
LILLEEMMKTTTWGALSLATVLLVGGATQPDAQGWQDALITRAFAEVLQRQPSASELRRYLDLMYEEHWTERDIQDDLRRRPDYQRHSQRRIEDPDSIVRRAYQDILHREPDTQGLRQYRSRLIDDNWTEYQVREALRKSPEHAERSAESADKIVRRAYQDVLGRDPDTNGLYASRNQILNQGWDEYDVREALRKSPEYRQKNAMTREQAEQVVRRAYLSVLGREPDPASRGYVDRVLRDHWGEGDVARELRNSDEYRNKRR